MRIVSSVTLSLEDALHRLSTSQRPRRDDLSSESNEPSSSWDLNVGFSGAASLARSGWREPVEEMTAYFEQIREMVEERVSLSYDVTGESVDIGRFLDGEPECMFTTTLQPLPAVRIVVSISARCSADAELLHNRGMGIAAAVYALQSSGREVSLMVYAASSDGKGGDLAEIGIEINRFGEYLNPGTIAFWLGHPAAFRRCIFRFKEQLPASIRDQFGYFSDGGYGYAIDAPANSETTRDAIYIPFPESDTLWRYKTKEEALKHVAQLMGEQGISLQVRE